MNRFFAVLIFTGFVFSGCSASTSMFSTPPKVVPALPWSNFSQIYHSNGEFYIQYYDLMMDELVYHCGGESEAKKNPSYIDFLNQRNWVKAGNQWNFAKAGNLGFHMHRSAPLRLTGYHLSVQHSFLISLLRPLRERRQDGSSILNALQREQAYSFLRSFLDALFYTPLKQMFEEHPNVLRDSLEVLKPADRIDLQKMLSSQQLPRPTISYPAPVSGSLAPGPFKTAIDFEDPMEYSDYKYAFRDYNYGLIYYGNYLKYLHEALDGKLTYHRNEEMEIQKRWDATGLDKINPNHSEVQLPFGRDEMLLALINVVTNGKTHKWHKENVGHHKLHPDLRRQTYAYFKVFVAREIFFHQMSSVSDSVQAKVAGALKQNDRDDFVKWQRQWMNEEQLRQHQQAQDHLVRTFVVENENRINDVDPNYGRWPDPE